MTVKELKEKLNCYPDDMPVVFYDPEDIRGTIHFKLGDIEESWDDDYERNVVVLYN